jgi:hypothetical protein
MITDLYVSKFNIIEIGNMLRELFVGKMHLNSVPMLLLPGSLS